MTDHIVTPQAMPANHSFAFAPLRRSAPLLIACVLLASCSVGKNQAGSINTSSINPVNWLTPYKVDVIQGNFVSREQVAQLRPGLTRDQVKGVLGTPLVASMFHADRWDYVFTLQRQGVEKQSYKYTVYFTGDQLVKFEGDAMPSETDFIEKLDNKRKFGKVPVLEATEEQLKAADKSAGSRPSASSDAAAPVAPAAVPPVNYPPLESARR
jgi:outer membrane protein assembly factor BamE